jgi:CheY-like chemotaxis protein
VNLISNAIKFTEKGEIFVSVELLDNNENNLKIKFNVKDTGIGLNKENMSKLFKPFTQADSSINRKYGGTGLGLAISKRLVELMGGNIFVDSIENEGTTFSFTLNLEKSEDNTKVYLNNSKLKDKKILIVEHNQTNLMVLSKQIENWGMIPTSINSSIEAINILNKNNDFDLAIIDMQITDLNGYELTQKIRNKYSKKDLPIIITSTIKTNETENLFSCYLNKPIKHSQLFNAINNELCNEKINIKNTNIFDDINIISSDLKILLAEDNLINQKLAIRILEKLGYKADKVNNGLEVIEILKTNNYDLILMDIQMPEMDGIEATKYILKNFKNPPKIIAMTANAMKEDRESCLNAGMDDYISKPISIQTIKNLLDKYNSTLKNTKITQ